MGKRKFNREPRHLVKNYDGQVVGEVKGGCLVKGAQASRHMLRNPRGWTWDSSILAEAETCGVTQTQIIDSEAGVTYSASITDFHEHGVPINYGYGPQLCLPIEHWTITGSDARIHKKRKKA